MSLEQLSRNSHCPKCGHYFARQKETHRDLARQVCAKRDFRVLDIIASGIKRMCHISAQFDPPLGKTQTQRSIWRLVTAVMSFEPEPRERSSNARRTALMSHARPSRGRHE